MGAVAGVDVLLFSCCCQDLNPRSSSVCTSHCTECAAPYWFEEGAKRVY